MSFVKNKELFLEYCKRYNKELEDLQNEINFEGTENENGTLAYIGNNFSYDLAIIGFELYYVNWHFKINGTFEEIKKDFINTIMYEEKMNNIYTSEELETIKETLLKARKNEGVK